MARQTITKLVCDGCQGDYDESAKGSAEGTYTLAGEDGKRHAIDLCPECADKLPAGTIKNKPGRKAKK